MNARQYMLRFAFLSALGLGILAVFNWIVDPFYLFASPDRTGINQLRTQFFNSQLLSKPYAVSRYRPDAIMLGSSRTGTALRPAHPALANYRTYNAALAGSTLDANLLMYYHASAQRPLKLVLMNADFYMFNAYQRPPNAAAYRDYAKRVQRSLDGSNNWSRYPTAIADYLDTLLAWNTLKNSVQTIMGQSAVAAGRKPLLTIHPDGHWTNQVASQRDHNSYFKQVERIYIPAGWVPPDSHRFGFTREGSQDPSPLDRFADFLRHAYSNETEVIITFMPYHARLLEAMHLIGIWQQSEEWKRQMIAVTDKVAAEFNRPPFPIWDFTGYNTVNMEALPPTGATGNQMRWYRDASHVQQSTGDLIINRIMNYAGASAAPDDFGVRIHAGNIEQHLDSINARRKDFLQQRQDDVREIRQTVRRANARDVVR